LAENITIPLEIRVSPKVPSPGYDVVLKCQDGSEISGDLDLNELKTRLGNLRPLYESHQPEQYGQALFNALFSAPLMVTYGRVLGAAGRNKIRLTLQLYEDDPALWSIPWERMYHIQDNRWVPLCADTNVFFSRYLPSGDRWGLPLSQGKLRVLIVVASPYSQDEEKLYVDVDKERQNIASILQVFPDQVDKPEFLEGLVTPDTIRNKLLSGQGYDILHYVGHGSWDNDDQAASLIMEEKVDQAVGPVSVPCQEFVQQVLPVGHTPALVVMSSCTSSMPLTAKAFMGVGPLLVKAGCPAVICMQEEIEVDVARRFSQSFYKYLLAHGTIDMAVCQARHELLQSGDWQWALPVLFLRQENGVLFDPEERYGAPALKPYKFLACYSSKDRELFKGRQQEIDQIYHDICENKITVVYGEPGIGLTSLVEAGLRPVLQDEGDLVIRLCEYPDLVSEIYLQIQKEEHPIRLHIRPDDPLPEVIRAITGQRFPQYVLVLDQFERALDLPEAELNKIITDLQEALEEQEKVRVVLVLHTDHLDRLASLQDKLKGLRESWSVLNPLNGENAFKAIWEPLEILKWPVTLSEELAKKRIVPDLDRLCPERYRGQSQGIMVHPGHLQIICNWLYRHALSENQHRIDEALYAREGGGAEGIMVRFMEDEIHTHFSNVEQLTRRILVSMAEPHKERWLDSENLGIPSEKQESVHFILDKLVDAGLLITRTMENKIYYSFANQVISNEARKLGGEEIEKSYQAQDELERAWRLWLAALARRKDDSDAPDRALPTIEQMNYLEELRNQIQPLPTPDRILMLLRTVILRNLSPAPWIEWLISSEKQEPVLKNLDVLSTAEVRHASDDPILERIKFLLSLTELPPFSLQYPERNNPVNTPEDAIDWPGQSAWAAVHAGDTTTRQTAAAVLMVLHREADLAQKKLNAALSNITSGWKRQRRRAEVFGSMEDAGLLPSGSLENLSFMQRVGVYFWRAWRRIKLDEQRIRYLIVGGLLGTGIGMGLLRFLSGLFYNLRPYGNQLLLARSFLTLYFFYGMFLGFAATAGIALAGPLVTQKGILRRNMHQPGIRQAALAALLGTLCFGTASLLLALMSGLVPAKAVLVTPMCFIAGGGLCLALWGLPGTPDKPIKLWHWIVRAVLVGLFFVALQSLFLTLPEAGSGLPFVLDRAFYQSYYGEFAFNLWKVIVQRIPDWSQILSLLDAFFTGAVLFLGLGIGLRFASRQLALKNLKPSSIFEENDQ
jgi:hypothetical protein